jgi:hypothetical protein
MKRPSEYEVLSVHGWHFLSVKWPAISGRVPEVDAHFRHMAVYFVYLKSAIVGEKRIDGDDIIGFGEG